MRLKITSDGTSTGTRITNAETGELLEMVTAIRWSIASSSNGQIGRAVIEVDLIDVDLAGDVVI